jgi:Fe-S-cluster containining protein
MARRETLPQLPVDPPGTLRFSCQRGCTRCCEVTGYVYLSPADSRNIARYLGTTVAAFERQYVYRTRHLRRLRKPRGAQCHFLRDGGCSIHVVKPVQCRLFPFWPDLIEERAAWRRTAEYCPGIGQGQLVQIGEAMQIANEMRTAYPTFY